MAEANDSKVSSMMRAVSTETETVDSGVLLQRVSGEAGRTEVSGASKSNSEGKEVVLHTGSDVVFMDATNVQLKALLDELQNKHVHELEEMVQKLQAEREEKEAAQKEAERLRVDAEEREQLREEVNKLKEEKQKSEAAIEEWKRSVSEKDELAKELLAEIVRLKTETNAGQDPDNERQRAQIRALEESVKERDGAIGGMKQQLRKMDDQILRLSEKNWARDQVISKFHDEKDKHAKEMAMLMQENREKDRANDELKDLIKDHEEAAVLRLIELTAVQEELKESQTQLKIAESQREELQRRTKLQLSSNIEKEGMNQTFNENQTHDVETMRAQISELETAVKERDEAIGGMRVQLIEMDDQVLRLSEKNWARDQAISKFHDEKDKHANEMAMLMQDNREKDRVIDELKETMKKQAQENLGKLTAVHDELKRSKSAPIITETKKLTNDKNSEMDALIRSDKEKSDEIEKLRSKIGEYHKEIKERDEGIASMKEQLLEMDDQIMRLSEKNWARDQAIAKFHREQDKHTREMSTLMRHNRAKDSRIDDFKEMLKEQLQAKAKLLSEAEEKEKLLSIAVIDLKDLQAKLQTTSAEHLASLETITAVASELYSTPRSKGCWPLTRRTGKLRKIPREYMLGLLETIKNGTAQAQTAHNAIREHIDGANSAPTKANETTSSDDRGCKADVISMAS